MKVTKQELRKIIREERARLLRESMTDMADVQDAIEGAIRPLGDMFIAKMMALWDELPGAGYDDLTDVYPDKEAWAAAIDDAVLELDTSAARVVEEVIQDLEVRLINGDF